MAVRNHRAISDSLVDPLGIPPGWQSRLINVDLRRGYWNDYVEIAGRVCNRFPNQRVRIVEELNTNLRDALAAC